MKCYKLWLLWGMEEVWVEARSKLALAGKDFYGCCGSVQPQYDMLPPPDAPQI